MLVIATAMVSATSVKEEHIGTTSYEADVPVWEVTDSWTYNEQYNSFAYRNDGTTFYTWYLNCTSTYTVTDDTGDTYTVKMTTKNMEGRLTIGPYRIRFTPFYKVTQEIEHRKTDLAYVDMSTQEKGFVFWLIGNIGFPIPAYFSDIWENSLTPANEFLTFPLTAGTNGTFSSFTSTGNEKLALYFGLITIYDVEWTDLEFPAKNYTCEMADITVPAGDYEAYNVSRDEGSAQNFSYCYYVPEVGFYAKWTFHTELDDGKPVENNEAELVSTTYTP